MKLSLRGISWLNFSHLLFAALFALVAIALDHSELFRSFDRSLENRALYWILPQMEKKPPFVIIAVDTRLVEQFGCPPFNERALQKIEAGVARLELPELLLPDGEHVWLGIDTRDAAGPLHYLVPATLHWDSYSHRMMRDAPFPSKRVSPIKALSQPLVNREGFVRIIPHDQGANEVLPTLPHWLARRVLPEVRHPEEDEFVRFVGPAGSIPTLPLSRILAGEFGPRDVTNRIALLGISSSHCRPQLVVPTDSRGMSQAEAQIHAAMSLFQSPLILMSSWQRGLLIIGITLFVLLGVSRTRFGFRLVFLFAGIGGGIATAMAAAYYFNTLIPIAAPLVSSLLIYVYFSVHNAVYLIRELRENNARLATQIETWATPTESREEIPAKVNFEYLLDFASNFVPTKGAYLFVLPLEAYHYRLFLSINFREEDIRERRRDIRRMPWLGAISSAEGATLRGFMKTRDFDGYGIPIFDYGVVLGMVVFIVPEQMEIGERQAKVLSRLADYMGDILLGARTDTPQKRRALWRTFKTILGHDTLFGEVTHAQSISKGVSNQLARYRLILDQTALGIMVSDLIGNIYYLNNKASEFVTLLDPSFTKKLSNLLSLLLEGSQHTVSSIIESLLLGEDAEQIEWADQERGKTYHITFSAISTAQDEARDATEHAVTAILITVNDTTVSRQIDKLKSRVLSLASKKGKNIINQVRSSLAPPTAPWDEADKPESEAPRYTPPLSEAPIEEVNKIDNVFDEFSRLAEKMDEQHEGTTEIPFDMLSTVEETIQTLGALTLDKEITISVACPEITSPAFGNWSGFKYGLTTVLKDIVSTCVGGQHVDIEIVENGTLLEMWIIDPSAAPTDLMLSDIAGKAWDDIPGDLAEGLRGWDQAEIDFAVTSHGNSAMKIIVTLPKA